MSKGLIAIAASVLIMLGVSACGLTSSSGRTDITTAPNSANSIPQSPSSLPPGAQINAPFIPSTGTIFRSGY